MYNLGNLPSNTVKALDMALVESDPPGGVGGEASWFSTASRCVCCLEPAEESLLRLFIESDLVSSLWQLLLRSLGQMSAIAIFRQI